LFHSELENKKKNLKFLFPSKISLPLVPSLLLPILCRSRSCSKPTGRTEVNRRKRKEARVTQNHANMHKTAGATQRSRCNHNNVTSNAPSTGPPRFAPGSMPTLWRDIRVNERKLNSGCEIEFIEPLNSIDGSSYVSILKSEIDENIDKWSNTLVGYVIGNKPFYVHLKACISRLWKPKCSSDIFSRENGFFFFKFGSGDECNRVL